MRTGMDLHYSSVLCGLLLCAGCFLAGCDSADRKDQTEGTAVNTLKDDSVLVEAEPAVKVTAGADTTIKDNELMNRLHPQLSVAQVLQKYPEARIERKQPYPNRHNPGQIDTLITLKSDSTIFQFYRLPKKDLLQSATITKKGLRFGGSGIEIGMTAEEVASKIPPLRGRKTIPQTILIQAEQTPVALRLRFDRNRLEYIHYDGYVD